MAEASLITDDLQGLINVEFGPIEHEIEKGMVSKFAEAIEDANPLWQKVAPPTFPVVLRLEGFFEKLSTVKCSASRLLNGGNELEYYKPIKVGEVISVTGKLIDLQERAGRIGKMLFMTLELIYKNQKDEVVATGRSTLIRY